MTFVLADGTVVDTARPTPTTRCAARGPTCTRALAALRDEIRARRGARRAGSAGKFALKNTTGYSLNAFLDHDRPAEILAHLMVGSQGTLGFVADVTLRTVPEPPARATALLFFARAARTRRRPWRRSTAAGAAALEIMDAASLRSQARAHRCPSRSRTARPRCSSSCARPDAARPRRGGRARRGGARGRAARGAAALHDATRPSATRTGACARACSRRVGAMRPPGHRGRDRGRGGAASSAWRRRIDDLQALFARHGFEDAIVFGHARDGNLHFVLRRGLRAARTRCARYDAFMRGLVDAGRREVRRRAQGRARLGPQHGAVRARRVGRRAPTR